MQETWIQSLGWEDPLEKGMTTYSSILAWRIPWTEEPVGLQSLRSQRVRDSWATGTNYGLLHTVWNCPLLLFLIPTLLFRVSSFSVLISCKHIHVHLVSDFFFFFNWRIIALQCNVGFCHTLTWISHKYTYIPSLLNLPSNPALRPPLGHDRARAPGWAPCVIQQLPVSHLFYTVSVTSLESILSLKLRWCSTQSIVFLFIQ